MHLRNEGCRIDYTLVDKAMVPWLKKGGAIRSCGSDSDPCGEISALSAATGKGKFQKVPFEGGGIVMPSQEALDTQFGDKHTGIIYTPPSFSDHVAVSVLLEDSCCDRTLELDEKDSLTREAQPHKRQTSIDSFFMSSATSGFEDVSSGKLSSNSIRPPQRKRKGIEKFLVPQTSRVGSSANNGSSTAAVKKNRSTWSRRSCKKPSILQHFQKKK
jgi:hypothetical protein